MPVGWVILCFIIRRILWGEGMQSTLGVSVAIDSKEKLYKCDWSSCKGEHESKITYPKKGRVTKSGYREKWIAAGMQPCDLYGKIRKLLQKNGGS